jgi:hypothetical protein
VRTFIPRNKFEFKVFTSIKDILVYLGLPNYLHLFTDNKLSAVSDFYNLDDFKLKKLLMPKPIRNQILRYTEFFNKKLKKMRRMQQKKSKDKKERDERKKAQSMQ